MARWIATAAALAAASGLAGCGFQPLYGTPAVSPALSSIEPVLPGTSRTGFLLKESLNHEFARDADEPAHYRLTLKLTEYRFLVVEHSVEIYGGLVAALFSGLGIWLGLTLTRKKAQAQTSTQQRAAPANAQFTADQKRMTEQVRPDLHAIETPFVLLGADPNERGCVGEQGWLRRCRHFSTFAIPGAGIFHSIGGI